MANNDLKIKVIFEAELTESFKNYANTLLIDYGIKLNHIHFEYADRSTIDKK